MIDPARDSRWYEQRKRALVTASLGRRRYERAFEPACGYGALTRELAPRCAELIAMDADEKSVQGARAAHDRGAHVAISRGRLPEAWPDGTFDLIVLSEWLYYLDENEFAVVCDHVARTLRSGGDVVAVHWAQPIPETTATALSFHEAIGRAVNGRRFILVRDDDFVLDGWTRRARTLAQTEGLR